MSSFKAMKFKAESPKQSEALQKVLQSRGYDWEYAKYKGTVQTCPTGELYASNEGKLYSGVIEPDEYVETNTTAFLAQHTKPASLEEAYDSPPAGPWFDNVSGQAPLADDTAIVDVMFRDGTVLTESVYNWDWKFHTGESPSEIVKWRYHNAAEYYKQPETPAKSIRMGYVWELKNGSSIEFVEPPEAPASIDKHYAFTYTLTEADKLAGKIKVDPYFVAQQWKLGSKDDTGVVFHCLKTLARYTDKNSKEREINALHKSIIRLAQLEGVELK